MNDAVINPEFFSLASQLYVRMRRYGRVVDAVYMAKNHDYAREILQLAGREADVEILKIIVRFEILLAHFVAGLCGHLKRSRQPYQRCLFYLLL